MMYFGGPGGSPRSRMELESIGRLLLFLGLGIAALGGVLLLLSRIPGLNRLGNLPGDVRIQTDGLTCIVPIVSMIIISVLVTILANIIIRLLNR